MLSRRHSRRFDASAWRCARAQRVAARDRCLARERRPPPAVHSPLAVSNLSRDRYDTRLSAALTCAHTWRGRGGRDCVRGSRCDRVQRNNNNYPPRYCYARRQINTPSYTRYSGYSAQCSTSVFIVRNDIILCSHTQYE